MLGRWLRRKKPLIVNIDMVLGAWRGVYQSGDVNIDSKRYIPGSIPTWTEWSGSSWVAAREQRLKGLELNKLPLPDEFWLHLSLPPGWTPDHPNEHKAMQQFGCWVSDTEWRPPSGRAPKPWEEARE
jgi:hypothetical protein